jgi:Spy/CpxP family protein refolding chaperone
MVRDFRFLGLSALVAAVVTGGALVYAQDPGPGGLRGRGPGFGPGRPLAGLALRGLDLTDAQQEQVRQLSRQSREQMRALMDRMRAAQEARRQAVEAIPFNESQVRAAMKELAEIEADLAVAEARLQSDVYALLTAEQQQRLQQMRAERQTRAKQR